MNTNPVVIRRLLGLFREAGYVESKNGVGGGWVLVTDPRQITLLDVLETVEPAVRNVRPAPGRTESRMPGGLLHPGHPDRHLCRRAEGIAERLARTSIASIVGKVKKQMQV